MLIHVISGLLHCYRVVSLFFTVVGVSPVICHYSLPLLLFSIAPVVGDCLHFNLPLSRVSTFRQSFHLSRGLPHFLQFSVHI